MDSLKTRLTHSLFLMARQYHKTPFNTTPIFSILVEFFSFNCLKIVETLYRKMNAQI